MRGEGEVGWKGFSGLLSFTLFERKGGEEWKPRPGQPGGILVVDLVDVLINGVFFFLLNMLRETVKAELVINKTFL